jgi:hypothetical protein
LLGATAEEMASDTVFLQKFKGLYLKAENPGTAGEGQVSYFDLTTAYITLHYHTDSDTSAFYYFIEQSTPNFNVYTHSSSSLAQAGTEQVYLEGLAGVKTYIDFAGVKDSITNRLGNDTSKLVINRAELVVPVDSSGLSVSALAAALSLYPTSLTLAYKTDSTYAFLSDTYLDIFDGMLNRSLQQYSFNLTYYVQGLFDDQALYHTSNTGMYLYPLYSTSDSYGTVVKLLERSYYTCGTLKSTGAKLKLTYTILE